MYIYLNVSQTVKKQRNFLNWELYVNMSLNILLYFIWADTFGMGQHAHWPSSVSQHVVSTGHSEVPFPQRTASTGSTNNHRTTPWAALISYPN